MEKKKYITPEIEEIIHSYLCYDEGVGHFSQGGNDEADANLGLLFDDENKEDEDLLDEEEDGAAEGFTLPVFHSLWD